MRIQTPQTLFGSIPLSEKGQPYGVATLGPDGLLEQGVSGSNIVYNNPAQAAAYLINGKIPSSMLPIATASTLGAIRIGSGLSIDSNGVVSAAGGGGGGGGTTINTANDITTNAVMYPMFFDGSAGALSTANYSDTKLQFNPSTGRLGAVIFTSLSDRRLKTNIRAIEYPLEKIDYLHGCTFNMIESGVLTGGLMAQDVEMVLPEAVVQEGEYKSVNYNAVIGLCVEAIKALRAEVIQLKTQLG